MTEKITVNTQLTEGKKEIDKLRKQQAEMRQRLRPDNARTIVIRLTSAAGGQADMEVTYLTTNANRVALFWAAFVLTRPLGATVGDFLDKPLADGGLALSRPIASLVLLLAVALLVWLIPQRAGSHPGAAATAQT